MPVTDRRPRSGMTLSRRPRHSRPMPMGAVALKRGRYGEFQLLPVREQADDLVTEPQDNTEER